VAAGISEQAESINVEEQPEPAKIEEQSGTDNKS
jgi:hypothetical protein